jgi:hypothetical protein
VSNIFERINEVRKKVSYVQKDKTVEGQGYKAVTHDAVTALLRNELIDQGIVIVPRLVSSSVDVIGQTQKGAQIIRYSAKYDVDFVNCDDPDDRVTCPTEAHANDSGDKAPGKAMSYATKYAMLKVFSIETGENEEGRVEPWVELVRIDEEQRESLTLLLEEVDADVPKFLAYMGVPSIEEIPAAKYDLAVQTAERKRKKADK